MMPKRLKFLVGYLKDKYLAPSDRPPPSLLLRGDMGAGKSWVLNQIFLDLEQNSDTTSLVPVRVPFQLTATNLVVNISKVLEKAKRSSIMGGKLNHADAQKKKFLLLIEGVDRLYNPPSARELSVPRRAIGSGASFITQVQHARELRAFLIENSKNVSVIATSNHDIRFIEDPDLPFFNFFNLIEVKPLSSQESLDYVASQLKGNPTADSLFALLVRLYGHVLIEIADGSIALLNLFVGGLFEISSRLGKGGVKKDAVEHFLALYFSNITPYVELTIQSLSFTERLLVDELTRAPTQFSSKDIDPLEINLSKTLSNLGAKLVIERVGEARPAAYRFRKESVRSWLRYHRRIDLGNQ